VYLGAFLLAGVTPFYHPAFQTLIPRVTEANRLPQANAWLQTVDNFIAFAGPLLGGVCIAAIGTTLALFADALSFFVSALLIAAIRLPTELRTPEDRVDSSLVSDLGEALRFLWKNPILRYGSLLFMEANFVTTMIQANYVYFLTRLLGVTPDQLGLAFALPGIGAILGALCVPKLSKLCPPGTLILVCDVMSGIMILPLLIAKNVLDVAIPWTIVTALATVTNVTWFTIRQQIVPKSILGRVVALTRLLAFTAIPVGAAIGGAIVGVTNNMCIIIYIAAFARILCAGFGFSTSLSRYKPHNDT
jgi:Na+/melibiose symporter-like transporter